ncbi:MAG: hypothetical protein E7Z92_01085 [Cyanobacteria bacterium SIG31]|nr:hypothetical protein [Cyanobacteria bacterium SIG31]
MGYLSNFIVYTFAMVGVIMLALFVFKTSTSGGNKNSSKFLKVHDTLSLGPRKTLYIVSAGEEKFLIAGDVDKTCLISKLGEKTEENISTPEIKNNYSQTSFKEMVENHDKKYIDYAGLGIKPGRTKNGNSVMKNIAEILRS